jgi:hypothetical protein
MVRLEMKPCPGTSDAHLLVQVTASGVCRQCKLSCALIFVDDCEWLGGDIAGVSREADLIAFTRLAPKHEAESPVI